MRVQVRLFAGLRDRAGSEEVTVELPDGANVGNALDRLRWLVLECPVVMAVNREYADVETALTAGDELALIPPVSGGESARPSARRHIRITPEPLTSDPLMRFVSDPRAGAIVVFHGVTRDVPALEYEAYTEMAESTLASIADAAMERHSLCAAAIEHRIGSVGLSEPSVIVAASAPHRPEAFAGARELIDAIKASAPIWKCEEGRWVEGHVPASQP